MSKPDRVIVPTDFRGNQSPAEWPSRIVVEQAEFKVSQDPQVILSTTPLGSGIGIAAYDPEARVGGLLNCMLPTASLDQRRAAARPGLFLDTGWCALLECLRPLKAGPGPLRVFVAGGAEVMDDASGYNIGRINQDFLRDFLLRSGVTLNAENLGGRTNCSMELFISSGEVRLRFTGQLVSQFLCKP